MTKETKSFEKVEPKATPVKYTVEQLIASKKYKQHRDIIAGSLDADKAYTLDDVDKIIKNYLERRVM
jgi:hypothetical protein